MYHEKTKGVCMCEDGFSLAKKRGLWGFKIFFLKQETLLQSSFLRSQYFPCGTWSLSVRFPPLSVMSGVDAGKGSVSEHIQTSSFSLCAHLSLN